MAGIALPLNMPNFYQYEYVLTSNSARFPTITLPGVYDCILLYINITGYGGSDVVSIQFNGDSGTNYMSRFGTCPAGSGTITDATTTSDTLIRCGLVISKPRCVQAQIETRQDKSKLVQMSVCIGSGDPTTAPAAHAYCFGEWSPTVPADIKTIDLLTAGGLNMLAKSNVLLQAWQKST
jgi:hypothetical protein